MPNRTVHSGCIHPTQATALLVIVLVSRIQKSGTGDNNFVKWKRAILPWVPEAFHARFPDSETTYETKVPIVREKEPLVPRVGPFQSDRPK